ncbi:Linoleate 13S-lipoxygenase 2-1, chloroplastic [Capsicum baccatum]|uniref:Linoleate 13S-lipoxygenase 2-1, chloroplastic n=1 Tax=Capsicum baccatum TaxID=33114 RepID=A0A2G2XNX7_CAPBA|nr:Linoleate 13S-lipoxygenase 2-1, chloroplastic [Capsicum baccatum]
MLKPNLQQSSQSIKTLIPWSSKPLVLASLPINILNENFRLKKKKNIRIHYNSTNSTKAVLSSTKKSTDIKIVVNVQKNVGGTNLGLSRRLDDLFGKSLLLWIVAAELDPKTGIEKPSIRTFAKRGRDVDGDTHYEANFVIPEDFGGVGAVSVENEHQKEIYVKNIVIDGFPYGKVNITCNSWVHTKFDNPEKRIFFTNKSYIPSQTPSGLKRLREKELVTVRGDGFGERIKFERIYDYDVYNDIGDPDGNGDGKRPVLGGKELPYPRRCRTGRPRSKKDPLSESRSNSVYVPRDETFSEEKSLTFSSNAVYSVLQAVVPVLELVDRNHEYLHFPSTGSQFNVNVDIPRLGNKKNGKFNFIPTLIKAMSDIQKDVMLPETPQLLQRDKFSWFRDVEFARQTLASFNPYSIRLVKGIITQRLIGLLLVLLGIFH